MDIQINTEMPVLFPRGIHVEMVKLILLNEHYWRCMYFFSSHNFPPCETSMWQPQSVLCQYTSRPGGKEKKTVRSREKKSAYIVCVDVPRHVSIRNKLSVNVASDFTVPPAAVDVNYADHVPLRVRRESHGTDLISELQNRSLITCVIIFLF